METLKLKLERLKREEKAFKEALASNIKLQHEIMIAMFKEKTGLRKGDALRLKSGESGEITGFKVNYSWVNPIMCFYKKDGTVGKKEMILYDWDIKEAVIEKSGEIE